MNDLANFSGAPTIGLANLKTGDVTTIPGVTSGSVSGLAVDSSSQTAVAGSYEGFGLYHLGTGSGALIQPGGSTYQMPAADPAHGEFLVEEVASPDEFGGSPNNNSMSSVLVTNESGTVLKRIEAFNFYNIYLLSMGDYLQVNPTTSTAFALGPGGTQLYPFHY